MTLTANGSKGHHKFTLDINEDSTSGNSSFLSYTFKLNLINPGSGWNWYGFGNDVSYTITIGSNTYTGTIPSYDASGAVTLKSGSNIEIAHDSDGTKTITIGFSVTDTSGSPYTSGSASASDSMTLTPLHKAPDVTACSITSENNSQLSNLGLTTNVIAQYLSKKNFQISCTAYDNANISQIRIYHNNKLLAGYIVVGGSSTTTVTLQVDFSAAGELLTTISNNKHYAEFIVEATDDKDSVNTKTYSFEVIKYTIPTIEKASSSIKRKTGGGTSLTDNEAELNFVGTIYKGNDVIGNNNTQQVQYKIWNTTEPSYTNVASSESGGTVTINNYQISNIEYTKSYDYKIKIKDTFTNLDTTECVKTDRVSTGVALWTEYKDRVDFLSATIGGNPIIDSGSNTDGNYIKYYDGTMICYKSVTDNVAMTSAWGSLYEGSMSLGNWPETFISTPNVQITNASSAGAMIESYDIAPTTTSAGEIFLARATSRTADVTINVWAIGKWK